VPSQARRMRRARRVSECGRPDKPDVPPLGQLGSPEAREATVAPVPGVPVCHPCPPSGPAALAARLACRSSRYSQPGHSSDRLWYARNTWTCRLICPQDARSPRAGGLCSRYGSLSQRYGSLSRQGREGSRTGGGRAPERAGQDGQGTAGGCPGSEARGTSRPGQARMGPGHRLGNRQGSPGAAPARNENGPGCLARQAFDCLGLALAAAGPAQGKSRRSRSPSPVTGTSTGRLSAQPGRGLFADHNRQIPWQAETLARPEYSSRSGRSGHVLTSADPGVGQPSGLRVVHLVRHGAGRPPPRQGRRSYRRRRCAPHRSPSVDHAA
jgi:hypothetical protein